MNSPHATSHASQPRERFGATEDQWRDWRWQQRHAVTRGDDLARALDLVEEEREGLRHLGSLLRLGVTPYYLSLADRFNPFCPVRMQIVPRAAEVERGVGELVDPLGEDRHRPVPAVVHRYPDRALVLAVERCSVYCRHCTRRRLTGSAEPGIDRAALDQAIEYVRAHPEVRDVIVSGGDPLLLSDERLDELLGRLKAVPHVEILRVGTRMPVANPMRVSPTLVKVLRRHAPLFVVTHFNHPKEITNEAREACGLLVDGGVPVENQTVLMRRINSSARILTDLSHRLLTMRVRPYYLHQMDVAEGLEHLRTPLAKGVEIIERMRGFTSGLAVPHFAVDLPGGGGKVTLAPDYVLERGERSTALRNYRGVRYEYPEPAETDCDCPYERVFYGEQGGGGS